MLTSPGKFKPLGIEAGQPKLTPQAKSQGAPAPVANPAQISTGDIAGVRQGKQQP
jgi:hypothetical protein